MEGCGPYQNDCCKIAIALTTSVAGQCVFSCAQNVQDIIEDLLLNHKCGFGLESLSRNLVPHVDS
jgi:hypothetical protein